MNAIIKKYRATFAEGFLATKPNDEEIHTSYVVGKAGEARPDEVDAELRALEELEDLERGQTIFHRDEEGRPIIWNYQVKGFLKEAFRALSRDKSNACAKVPAYIKVIDQCVFVEPRKIPLILPEGAEMGSCQRPLRAQTPKGERVALACSEEVPAGTTMEFSVRCLVPGLDKAFAECWEYAELRFMGGWRNSGKGTAKVEEIG